MRNIELSPVIHLTNGGDFLALVLLFVLEISGSLRPRMTMKDLQDSTPAFMRCLLKFFPVSTTAQREVARVAIGVVAMHYGEQPRRVNLNAPVSVQ